MTDGELNDLLDNADEADQSEILAMLGEDEVVDMIADGSEEQQADGEGEGRAGQGC